MIREGETAPDFALPGVERGEPDVYELFRPIENGDAVLLWFVPSPFVPTATAELAAINRAGWHDCEGLQVWVVSMESIYAAAAYADDHGFPMAFLGDGASAADYYGVKQDEWEGHYNVPERAAFFIDDDWTVEAAWRRADAFERPSPSPVEVVAASVAEHVPAATADVSVEYDECFGG
ncbi:peroxiredoxin domain protein [Natronomonas pharaonis DSM 2160]|uniref:Peroxiredoxin domain protein n=1 Tax=Natronomonas pharaonis (strain ATCC 35678 / DSM 2160 / CIP 103997 / JCM 8858 / NBRC 14720 / NCIMB 2260 / Gabara) TaxID=348780 RepID=A0A1U7EV42_NATPD|nr:redoxin domain-containing protein [Natronomonas pharaonis]CAI48883.1 peroxiredoxin domain protein [Natronomonas pharaonis DSM 2160]